MLNLQKRIKGIDEDKKYLGTRISIRDKLLSQEVQELETGLKDVHTCRLHFPSTSELHKMELTVTPNTGLYKGGWMPTRRLIDVILGLDSLFTDLMDFDDALNAQAAQQYASNKDAFAAKVREYINRYCRQ
uniref:UBC core domain-containing protein n=1 Tax=Acrobeloides nanus TaxID=290746 RepID=A0A914C5A6_9BILA